MARGFGFFLWWKAMAKEGMEVVEGERMEVDDEGAEKLTLDLLQVSGWVGGWFFFFLVGMGRKGWGGLAVAERDVLFWCVSF